MSADIINSIMSAECGYQVLVTKICRGGRNSYILTNFIPNFSALNSKHFMCLLFDEEPPELQQDYYTVLNQKFVLIAAHIGEPHADTDNL